jgi:hypothetical protein
MLACEKSDSNQHSDLQITHVEYSGCFDKGLNNAKATDSIGLVDSLYYTIENTALMLHINKMFSCCSSLTDSFSVANNEVNIYLGNDDDKSMICNCICAYHYKYTLANAFQKNIYFKVYVKEYLDKEYKLWKETSFINGLD